MPDDMLPDDDSYQALVGDMDKRITVLERALRYAASQLANCAETAEPKTAELLRSESVRLMAVANWKGLPG